MSDILQVQGINEKGFGIIPKLVMQDKRLTAEAKAIYGYFCSYAGAGRTAFPSRNKIVSDLGMSINRYYSHFRLLTDCGYIVVERQPPVKGILQRNIYTLIESVPCIQNRDMEEPCIRYPDMDDPCMDNEYTKSNSLKNNSSKSISQSSPSAKTDRQDEDETQRLDAYTALIKDNIGYSSLQVARPYDIPLIDEFIAVMLDTIMTDSPTVRIGGEDKPRELVRRSLLSLGYDDIEHATDQFKGITERVAKKRQYILTLLYNCKMELHTHLTNAVRSNAP